METLKPFMRMTRSKSEKSKFENIRNILISKLQYLIKRTNASLTEKSKLKFILEIYTNICNNYKILNFCNFIKIVTNNIKRLTIEMKNIHQQPLTVRILTTFRRFIKIRSDEKYNIVYSLYKSLPICLVREIINYL
jgi:hypothetical protein